jgi:hypothetical protein
MGLRGWQGSKHCFFEKKQQKTFVYCGRWLGWCHSPQERSFFASFCLQKDVLAQTHVL